VLNIAAGLVLGLLLGVGLAWLRERLRPAVHTAEEAAEVLEPPLLASIPLSRRFIPGDPQVAEGYDVLRTNLTLQSREHTLRTVVFLSHNPGVGKSSSVEGIGYAAMRAGSNVVLVDGDLRAGTLSERLGNTPSAAPPPKRKERAGLRDVVLQATPLDDVLVELGPNLTLLPAGTGAESPMSLLYAPRVEEVLAELRDRFDLVVIDSPPVAYLADGLILASLADAAVIVARSDITSRRDLQRVVATLRPTNTRIAGFVMFEPIEADRSYYGSGIAARPMTLDPAPH
jgi:capsular exopolysaccharide synthesis family protein